MHQLTGNLTGNVAGVLAVASQAAFGLAWLSAVAGFGGGVLLLPVFTALFGLRTAVPVLTLTQLSSNGSRVWLHRWDLRWPIIARFAVGATPFAVAGGLLLSRARSARCSGCSGCSCSGCWCGGGCARIRDRRDRRRSPQSVRGPGWGRRCSGRWVH